MNIAFEYGITYRHKVSCCHGEFTRHVDDGITGDHSVGIDRVMKVFNERLSVGVTSEEVAEYGFMHGTNNG